MSDALAECLSRMERLIEALEETRDTPARTLARTLLDSCLDLHGLALARVLTIASSGAEGGRLLAAFAADDYVSAALLLHGLHPEEPEARLRRAIAGLRETWGASIDLLDVSHAVARVSLRLPDEGADRATARREIERTLTEAAPDLDSIIIEDRAPAAPSLAE
ncbi:nitrogen fixation protein NifU [Methylosinus sp. Sm6]|uniref:nitrogen fixation protein NifU n=1 Tax=Methylosinus sp. Sm6 TaxID=2866948 RepID=UPI001C997F08|nr:nitrogen fixation protein NifU [Methylosinus sp. Sm6]MBY6242553.1 nitrogen fixation protein NifU [Methylosinus sp. Sm6]